MPSRTRWGGFPWPGAVLLVALAAATRSPTIIVLAAAGLAGWGIASATGRLALAAVGVDVALEPRRLVAGETAVLTVQVTNRKPLPIPWLDLRIDLPAGISPPRLASGAVLDEGSSVRASLAPRAHERVTLRFPLRVRSRGAYVLGPLRVRGGDWLGFSWEEREIDIQLEIVAHPAPVNVADLHVASLRPVTEAPVRRGLVPDPLRFRGVRGYQGGDPIRQIHWKTSARLGSLHTKVYEPATSLDAVFLLNVASYEQYWVQADPEGAELIIAATAELVRLAARAGRQVGLITNGLDNLTHERPHSALSRGPRALRRCLDILARLGPYAGAAPEAVFLRERGRIASGATLVAVTPVVPPRLAGTLEVLRRSGHRVLAVVKDPVAPAVAEHLRAADVPFVVLSSVDGELQRPGGPRLRRAS